MIANPRSADDKPYIVAHRGWRDPAHAENSFGEMRQTWAAGRWMMEVDLSTNRDGTLFLLHDDTVDRTTNGHGALSDLSDHDVARLRLKDGSGSLTTEGVPRFDAIIDWMAATPGIALMLDIKHVHPAPVAAIVRAAGVADRVVILTFDRATAKAAFDADPDWVVSVLVNTPAELAELRALAKARPCAVYLPTFAPPALFRAGRQAGLTVITDAVMATQGASLDARAQAEGVDVYRRYLTERPVDMLVTNYANAIPNMQAATR